MAVVFVMTISDSNRCDAHTNTWTILSLLGVRGSQYAVKCQHETQQNRPQPTDKRSVANTTLLLHVFSLFCPPRRGLFASNIPARVTSDNTGASLVRSSTQTSRPLIIYSYLSSDVPSFSFALITYFHFPPPKSLVVSHATSTGNYVCRQHIQPKRRHDDVALHPRRLGHS